MCYEANAVILRIAPGLGGEQPLTTHARADLDTRRSVERQRVFAWRARRAFLRVARGWRSGWRSAWGFLRGAQGAVLGRGRGSVCV